MIYVARNVNLGDGRFRQTRPHGKLLLARLPCSVLCLVWRVTVPAASNCRPLSRAAATARSPRRAAFTLVELLVVVGIIALLIAVLMPALSTARRQAQTIRCAANLNDIGRAVQLYANDFRGRIPRGYHYNQDYQRGHILWAEALSPTSAGWSSRATCRRPATR